MSEFTRKCIIVNLITIYWVKDMAMGFFSIWDSPFSTKNRFPSIREFYENILSISW